MNRSTLIRFRTEDKNDRVELLLFTLYIRQLPNKLVPQSANSHCTDSKDPSKYRINRVLTQIYLWVLLFYDSDSRGVMTHQLNQSWGQFLFVLLDGRKRHHRSIHDYIFDTFRIGYSNRLYSQQQISQTGFSDWLRYSTFRLCVNASEETPKMLNSLLLTLCESYGTIFHCFEVFVYCSKGEDLYDGLVILNFSKWLKFSKTWLFARLVPWTLDSSSSSGAKYFFFCHFRLSLSLLRLN